MNNIVIIQQPNGLGDILFCQKIAIKLIENGYIVYWDTSPRYGWVGDYIHVENLNFIKKPDNVKNFHHLNLQYTMPENNPFDVMTVKYKGIGKWLKSLPRELHDIDWSDWSDYVFIDRKIEKENELYYNVLGLKNNEKYVFCNNMFGLNQKRNDIKDRIKDKTLKIVDLSFMNGYTLFDWCKVIENASEIHTVDTSINYLIDTLNLKTDVLILYPRMSEYSNDSYNCLAKLFKTEWEWIM